MERMVLDISDAMYFGHFHMESVMRMRKMKDLTLLVTEKGIRPSWDSRTRYLEKVARDFLEAKYSDPAWECPRVKVICADNGEELSTLKSGALIPGWKQGWVSWDDAAGRSMLTVARDEIPDDAHLAP